jgi:AcrR family transcriptional regulator
MSSERQRAARKTPDERAAEIRDAARSIALESGVNALTLRSIAARVGVTPALVAHYEPNMEQLIAATITAIVGAELNEVSAEIATHPSPTAALRALIRTLLEPERQATTAVWLDAWSLGLRVDVVSAAVREQMDAWQEFVAGIVREGIRQGEFATEEPDAVALQLVGMIDGLNAQSLVYYRDAPSRSRLVAGAIEHGLGLPPGTL